VNLKQAPGAHHLQVATLWSRCRCSPQSTTLLIQHKKSLIIILTPVAEKFTSNQKVLEPFFLTADANSQKWLNVSKHFKKIVENDKQRLVAPYHDCDSDKVSIHCWEGGSTVSQGPSQSASTPPTSIQHTIAFQGREESSTNTESETRQRGKFTCWRLTVEREALRLWRRVMCRRRGALYSEKRWLLNMALPMRAGVASMK
jgi:hypothetical protein